jgi:hypothetical protein
LGHHKNEMLLSYRGKNHQMEFSSLKKYFSKPPQMGKKFYSCRKWQR